jgi:hypothetical protein
MPNAVRRARGRFSAKKIGVGRIGAGIAGFDIVDAELVEHARDGELVGEREIDAVRLRAVAQRGVEQIKALAGHDAISPKIIIRRQRHRDHDGDERNHEMMGPHARKMSNLRVRSGENSTLHDAQPE